MYRRTFTVLSQDQYPIQSIQVKPLGILDIAFLPFFSWMRPFSAVCVLQRVTFTVARGTNQYLRLNNWS